MCQERKISDGVLGWRGVLGWVCPAVATSSHDVDFHLAVPEGVELKMITLGVTAHTSEEVDMALAGVDNAARRLVTNGAQFISVEGTPLVSFKGFGFDKEIIQRVENVAKVPATTSLTAAVDAMRTMNMKRIVMASPMNHEADERTIKFLQASGFEIIHVKSLNNLYPKDIETLPRSTAYTVAKQAFLEASHADGIYLPCGAWCPPWNIDCLEADLGVPVIHSRQATTWAGLKALHIKEPVKGWGKLFATLHSN